MVLLGIRRPRGRMAQVTRLVVNEGKGEKRAALIRAAERWRGLRMTEFERRQLIAIRNELDRAHAERTAPVVNANVTASPTRLFSNTRT